MRKFKVTFIHQGAFMPIANTEILLFQTYTDCVRWCVQQAEWSGSKYKIEEL